MGGIMDLDELLEQFRQQWHYIPKSPWGVPFNLNDQQPNETPKHDE